MGTADFYDDLAELYDVIYGDWDGARARQVAALTKAFAQLDLDAPLRILDAASGVGTQTIPLLGKGHAVVARDLSTGAITRLRREAEAAGRAVDADVCSMTAVSASVSGEFDVVIALDNSIPHLLTDAEIGRAFAEFRRVLRPGGVLLASVRDYGPSDRSTRRVEYGERIREGRRFRVHQEWTWTGPEHYDTEMVVEEQVDHGWEELLRTRASYYAIPLQRMIPLMEQAGFEVRRIDREVDFFQPLLAGRSVSAGGDTATPAPPPGRP